MSLPDPTENQNIVNQSIVNYCKHLEQRIAVLEAINRDKTNPLPPGYSIVPIAKPKPNHLINQIYHSI